MKKLHMLRQRSMREHGEIALSLALVGIVLSLAGIGLGSVAVNQAQKSRGASAQNLYPYKSALELREVDGDVLKTDKKLTWHTTVLANSQYPDIKTSGQIQNLKTDRARLEWDATQGAGVPAEYQNRDTRIVVHIPEKWVVRDSYCTDHNQKGGCNGFHADITRNDSYDYVITGIKITQEADIEYGFIVEKASAPTPPTQPTQPAPGPSCGKICTYSQAEASGTKCYEGNCKDGSQNCSLNTNCGYVSGCSTGKKITCPGHSPVDPTGGPNPSSSPFPSPSPMPTTNPQVPDSAQVSVYLTFKCIGGNRDSFDNDRPKLEEYMKTHTLPWVDLQSTYNGQTIQAKYNLKFAIHNEPYYAYIDTSFDIKRLKDGGTILLSMVRPPDGFTFCGSPVHGLTKDTPFLNNETRRFVITPIDDVKPTPEPRPARPQSPAINRKILLLTYDIPLLSEEGISTFTYYEMKSRQAVNVDQIVNRTVDTLNTASGLNYQIVKKTNIITLNSFTTVNSAQVFEGLWKKCFLTDRTLCEKLKDDYTFSYKKLDEKLHICEMVNRGEIDEVWHAALPGLSMGEDDMFGPLPFGINGRIEVVKSCNRNVPTLSIDLTRDAEEAVHSFLHRVERTIAKVYGTEVDESNGGTPWNDFVAYPKIKGDGYEKPRLQEPYGCGSVHLPPNAHFEYDYRSETIAKTMCPEFFNYPYRRKGNIYEIGNFKTGMGFYRWFMVNMPRFPGRDQFHKLNNWWEYIAYPNKAIQDSDSMGLQLSDTNADMVINTLDISSMYNLLGERSADETGILYEDVNRDGVVNGYDLSEVMSHYGEEIPLEKPVHGSYWE